LEGIGGYDAKRGQKVAGHRGYFLKGPGVLLNTALSNFGLSILIKKGYIPIQPPYFMKKEIMEETCQISDFEENLYKVEGKGSEVTDNDYFLIATS
jgi:seryl-tRNA synthetase